MVDKAELKRQIAEMKKALFDEGYLGDRFTELENEHGGSATKMEEQIKQLFEEAVPKYMKELGKRMMSRRMLNMEDQIAQIAAEFKHIGAEMIENKCKELGKWNDKQDYEGFISAYVQVREEFEKLQKKLRAYFQLAKEAKDED